MVGLCGVVGHELSGRSEILDPLTCTGDERTTAYRDDAVAVRAALHPGATDEQPVETEDGALCWAWGEVYAVTDGTDRRPVRPRRTAAICAQRYDEHGRGFAAALDGEFVGCVYDRTAGTVSFFNDRLGARPLYYGSVDDGLVFSTSIQTLPRAPGFEPAFDRPYLSEFFRCKRVLGTKTPLRGIERLPPSTTLTYDLDTGTIDRHSYWEPRYRPVDEPLSYFVEAFARRFERAVADRTVDDREYGLLLSGGSDARLVLAAADVPIIAYHLGDRYNREARIAERTARTSGVEFEFLRRDPEYHAELAKRAPPLMEFIGTFDAAHALGFTERLREEVDVLFTGLYGDTFFGELNLRQPRVPLPFGGQVSVPIARPYATVADYIAEQRTVPSTRQPSYLRAPPLEEVLAANVRVENGSVDHHGVTYESFEQLSISELYYPLTNITDIDRLSYVQMLPTRSPFLDHRLIDLHLSLPLRYRLRHSPVHRAIERLDPSLAAIPHAASRVPLEYPRVAHVVGAIATDLIDKLSARSNAEPYHSEGPWQSKPELIRTHGFVEEAIREREDLIRRLPFLEWERVVETYRDHLDGRNNSQELYRLLTFLEMPIVERIADRHPTVADRESR